MPQLERLFSQPEIHSTLFEDKVYTHDDWEKHRSAAWRHRLEPVTFFRVAAGFMWQLLLVELVAVVVGILYETLGHKADKVLAGNHLMAPYTMITFALSLLLVFKTNSSYSRWWEGRIIWGQIVNFGRNYARQALLWFPPDRPELTAAALRWAAAAPRILAASLRQGLDPVGEARGLLAVQELSWLSAWANKPLGAGSALGELVAAAGLAPQLTAEMYRQVELYTNMAGGCERIFKTPIPPAYARHTSRFLMLYVVAAPVMLWPATGWATPLVAGVVAFLMLGVENIGVQVEEPFHVLPLYDICRAIEANIREMASHFPTAKGGTATAAAAGNDGDSAAAWEAMGAVELAARVHAASSDASAPRRPLFARAHAAPPDASASHEAAPLPPPRPPFAQQPRRQEPQQQQELQQQEPQQQYHGSARGRAASIDVSSPRSAAAPPLPPHRLSFAQRHPHQQHPCQAHQDQQHHPQQQDLQSARAPRQDSGSAPLWGDLCSGVRMYGQPGGGEAGGGLGAGAEAGAGGGLGRRSGVERAPGWGAGPLGEGVEAAGAERV